MVRVPEDRERRRAVIRSKYPNLVVNDAAERKDVRFLIDALTDPETRGGVALRLGDLRATEAVPALIRNLRVKSDFDRNAAVIALKKISDPSAIPELLEVATHDESWGIRGSAIEAVAALLRASTETL
jgi:HEAT repeat protein